MKLKTIILLIIFNIAFTNLILSFSIAGSLSNNNDEKCLALFKRALVDGDHIYLYKNMLRKVIMGRRVKSLRFLLDNWIDIDEVDEYGKTALNFIRERDPLNPSESLKLMIEMLEAEPARRNKIQKEFLEKRNSILYSIELISKIDLTKDLLAIVNNFLGQEPEIEELWHYNKSLTNSAEKSNSSCIIQ